MPFCNLGCPKSTT